MKNSIGERFQLSRDRIDVLVAFTGLVSAVLLLPLGYVTRELFVAAFPVTVGGASIAYLSFRQEDDTRQINQFQISGQKVRLLETGTILGIGGLALVAATNGERTLLFHSLSAVIGTLVLLNILFVSENQLRPVTIITEIVLLVLVVEFAALLTTPGLIGVDSWTHSTYARDIAQTGSLAPMAESKYIAAPLYHLLIVTAAKLFGSSIRTGLYGSLALVIPFSTIVVYFVGRSLLSTRWALVAMALFAMSDYLIHWSIDLIPTSMGLVFFLGLLYVVTKLFVTTNRRPIYILGFVFGVALILTHQISVFIALVFLASGAVAQLFVTHPSLPISINQINRYSPVNVAVLFIPLSVLTVVNWLLTPFGPGNFLIRLLEILGQSVDSAAFLSLRSVSSSTIAVEASILSSIPLSVELIDSLGLFILLFSTILGVLVILKPDTLDQLTLMLILSVSTMIVFSLGLPLFGIRTFLPGRWYAFAYALFAVVGALGLRNFAHKANLRTAVTILLILVLVFPGSMFVAQKATSENPVFDDSYPRYSYTTSELAAAQSIQDIQPADQEYVITDHPYRTLFERRFGQSSSTIRIDPETGTPANTDAVYREYQSSGTPVLDVGESSIRAQLRYTDICRPSSAVVYDNGPVKYCRSIDTS